MTLLPDPEQLLGVINDAQAQVKRYGSFRARSSTRKCV